MILFHHTIEEHASYLRDSTRLAAYARALAATTRPGDVVLDLGAGTGILGLLALKHGASHVYVVDEGPILELARAIHAANGTTARARFIRGNSRHVHLPEAVDVVVTDQAGYLGFGAGLLESLEDATRRHLRPGGRLVPGKIDIHVAPTEVPPSRDALAIWSSKPAGIDTSPGRLVSVSAAPWHLQVGAEALLGRGAPAATWDLRSSGRGLLTVQVQLTLERTGVLDGVGGWFVAHLAPGVTMTNAPTAAERIHRPWGFLPIDPPVPLPTGALVDVTLRVAPGSGLVAWTVSGESTPGGPGPWMRQHSTLEATMLSPTDLRMARPDHRPALGRRTRAKLLVLRLCDEGHDVQSIEREVQSRHSEVLPTPEAAQLFVREVLSRADS